MKAPFTMFGQTRLVPVKVVFANREIDSEKWDAELWIERGEDWYALQSSELRNKRVRIIERTAWLEAPQVTQQ